jgi:hypothetical protein
MITVNVSSGARSLGLGRIAIASICFWPLALVGRGFSHSGGSGLSGRIMCSACWGLFYQANCVIVCIRSLMLLPRMLEPATRATYYDLGWGITYQLAATVHRKQGAHFSLFARVSSE